MSLKNYFLAAGVAAAFLSQIPIANSQSTVLQGSVEKTHPANTRILQAGSAQTAVVTAPVAAPAPVTVRGRTSRQVHYVDRPVVHVVERPVYRTVYVRDDRTFFQKHPKVKATAIGAGVGAGVGAATGLITGHGILRGALIGTGAGAGVGLVRSSHTLRRHPVIRNVATGTLVGVGIGGAMGHGSRRALQGAGIGAAIGLGASILNHF